MALVERKRHREPYQGRRVRRRKFKRRRRVGLLVFLGLVVLTTLGVLILVGTDLLTVGDDEGSVEQVADPTVDEAPEIISEEEVADEESDAEEAAPPPPEDPTMSLTIPKLGIFDAFVDDSEAALELGAQYLFGTGYPWEKGANTYIAGHRIGFPGTGSDHIFYNIPSLTEGDEIILRDSLGREYTYQVSEVFAVTPFDLWVADPISDRDMVTLQTCTENPDDWWTVGPNLMSSGPESGRLIVRADRVT